MIYLSSLIGPRMAKLAMYVGVPLLAIVLLYVAITSYGKSRYKAGKADEEKAWQAASDKLLNQAAESATTANSASVARQLDFATRQEQEKESIDAAISNGASPADSFFGVR